MLAAALTAAVRATDTSDGDEAAGGSGEAGGFVVLRDVPAVTGAGLRRASTAAVKEPAPRRDVESPPARHRPMPRVGYQVHEFRRRAFARLGRVTFDRVDAEYTAAADATQAWLSWWKPPRQPNGLERDLFLCQLVHDSPARTQTLIRLRGYQAGFRRCGLVDEQIPTAVDLLTPGRLGGPGLSGPFTVEVAHRIRAAFAHPVLAGGLATALLTGLSPAALAIANWGHLSPGAEGLYLSRTHRTRPGWPESSARAAFWVPPAARPLLLAAQDFTVEHPGRRQRADSDRMFPPQLFGQPHLTYALQATGLQPTYLPKAGDGADNALSQDGLVLDLDHIWLAQRTKLLPISVRHRRRAPDEDEQFLLDQHFTPPAASGPP